MRLKSSRWPHLTFYRNFNFRDRFATLTAATQVTGRRVHFLSYRIRLILRAGVPLISLLRDTLSTAPRSPRRFRSVGVLGV